MFFSQVETYYYYYYYYYCYNYLIKYGKPWIFRLETACSSEQPIIPPQFPARKEASRCPLVAGRVVQAQ